MGVPDVALLAVVGFGGVLAERDRHQPFEPFVAEAGDHDGGEGVLEWPGIGGGDLDEGRGEAEAVGEVDEAVELVAAPAELGVERMAGYGLNPVVVGDVGVEPAGGYGVDRQEHDDEEEFLVAEALVGSPEGDEAEDGEGAVEGLFGGPGRGDPGGGEEG